MWIRVRSANRILTELLMLNGSAKGKNTSGRYSERVWVGNYIMVMGSSSELET